MTLATEKWAATWTARNTVLSTELSSIANGAYSAFGPAYDHTSNLDKWGRLKITLGSLSPSTGAALSFFMGISLDNATWENAPASTNPGWTMTQDGLIVPIDTTASSTKFQFSKPFILDPSYLKFACLNGCGVALASSGNTVVLETANFALF